MNKHGNPDFHKIRNTDNSKANQAIKKRVEREAIEFYEKLVSDKRFDMYKAGLARQNKKLTLAGIALFLERAQILTPSGKPNWHVQQVRRIDDKLKDLLKVSLFD